MGRKQITGLYERGGIWHIDNQIRGHGRLRESIGTSSREEAERFLIHRLEQLRQERVYGVRQIRTWRDAAKRHLLEYANQKSA